MKRSAAVLVTIGFVVSGNLIDPAQARVSAQSDRGFISSLATETPASRAETWEALIHPEEWWSGEHTYSGDAANLSLDARAGGCFCERLPGKDGQERGSIEHMRVVYADPERGVLRMVGALGPLQSEAVLGTLTMTITSSSAGHRITWEYTMGGYMRMQPAQIAPLVDTVLAEQLNRLAGSVASAARSDR